MLLSAYDVEERRLWLGDLDSNPHGQHWHTSFHASSFPGDDPYACGRKAVYDLLNPPSEQPLESWLRGWFDLGKNLELDWVRRFSMAGQLLSADQTAGDEHQTGFEDQEHWLTGSPDLIVLPPFWCKSHAIEVKTTSHEKVEAMRADPTMTPKSHEKYMRQLSAYVSFAHELPFAPTVAVCNHSGRLMRVGSCATGPLDGQRLQLHDGECQSSVITLDPPTDGTLIYSSREEPLKVATYWANYDPVFWEAGHEQLASWRDSFLKGEIPLHPRDDERAKWSVEPCQWCPLKKHVCKPDFQKKITRLADSHLVAFAQQVRPSYSYEETRQAVLNRWGAEDRSTSQEGAA